MSSSSVLACEESFLCRDSLESVRVSKREESATTTSPPKKSPNYTLILLLICFGLAMLVILGLFAWKIIVTLMVSCMMIIFMQLQL